jgi:hypothetical protein
MPRRRFDAFLAPHHPGGAHTMLQFRRDLDHIELRRICARGLVCASCVCQAVPT